MPSSAVLMLCLSVAVGAAPTPPSSPPPEALEMISAIAWGQPPQQGAGWYKPGESRHDWRRLAAQLHYYGTGPATAPEPASRLKLIDRWTMLLEHTRIGLVTLKDWNRYLARLDRGADRPSPNLLASGTMSGRISLPWVPMTMSSRWKLMQSFFRGELGSPFEGPALGDPAPDFTLGTYNGKGKLLLSKLHSRKPVVLIFGNFTCGPFRYQAGALEKLYERYHGDVEFLMVYTRESHPADGWRMPSNDEAGVVVYQPRTVEERGRVASRFCSSLRVPMPVVVDEVDDRVTHAYSGMPSRLYLVDQHGRVAYKGGRGPVGFIPGELEQALILHMLEGESTSAD